MRHCLENKNNSVASGIKVQYVNFSRDFAPTVPKGREMDFHSLLESGVDTISQTENGTTYHCPDTLNDTKILQIKEKAFALRYVSNAVIQYDKNLNIVWANNAALALSELTLKQIVGKCCCHVFWDFSCESNKCPVKSAFEDAQRCSTMIKTQDDKTLSVIALPFIDASGEVESVIEIIKNETHSEIVNKLLSDDYSEIVSFAEKLSLLTDREYEVMSWVVNGKSNKNISQGLCISCKTVEIHRSRVMKKLELGSLAELVRLFTLFQFYNKHIPYAILK